MAHGFFNYRILIAFLALPLFSETSTFAALLSYEFTGRVSEVMPELAGEFSVNEQIVGSFELDPVDIVPDNPDRGFYEIHNLHVQIGPDYEIEGDGGFLQVSPTSNLIMMIFIQGGQFSSPAVNGVDPQGFSLIYSPSSFLTSEAPPSGFTSPPFNQSSGLDFRNGTSIDYQLTSLHVVPEPASVVLLGIGAVVAATVTLFRRRGK
jgi:hypothetical protein